MRIFFILLQSYILCGFFNFSALLGQCPTSISVSNNSKCISVNPANSGTTVSGFTYLSGSNPALFYESTGNSNGCMTYTPPPGTTIYNINGQTCTYVNGILPVNFLTFNVKSDNRQARLDFSTASETNNDYFTVQRSGDALHFENIATIDGAGNSSTEIQYSFTDISPLGGTNYYRIKQTDFDGKFSYSDVRSVSKVTAEKSQLNTFITDNILVINTPLENYDVTIFNSWGAEVKRYTGMQKNSTFDVHDLRSGVHIIHISYPSRAETFRVVKL